MKWVDTFSTNMKKKVDRVLIQINKADCRESACTTISQTRSAIKISNR